MTMIPLSQTLVALISSIERAERPGVAVTAATIEVPLEAGMLPTRAGALFAAGPAHTRWRTGFMAPVHVAHVDVVRESRPVDER